MKMFKFRTKIEVVTVVFLIFTAIISASISASVTINDRGLTTSSSDFNLDFDDNNMTVENISAGNITVSGDYTGGNVANWNTAYTERGSQIAGDNLSWSGGQLHAVGGVDGFYNVTRIWNSNGNNWTATATNLQTAINDLGYNGVVYLPGNTTLTVTEEIRIDNMNNITIIGYGCTLKMCDDFYDSSTYLYMMSIGNSQDIILDGIIFEGNSGQQPGRDTVSIIVEDGSDRILIENCLFNDSKDGDITISIGNNGNGKGTVNLNNCHFTNFGGGTSAYSVYASSLNRLNVNQCHWTNYNTSGTPQCMYLDGGNDTSYTIDGCTAENIYVFASVRFGYAVFTNCLINQSVMGVISGAGSYESDVFTVVDHCYFTNNIGGSGGGLDTTCIWVHNGRIKVRDSYFTGDAPYNYYGILLEDNDSFSPTRNCLIDGCYFGNYSYGVMISGTTGNHTICNCHFEDCINYGIRSESNIYSSVYYDCYFGDVTEIYELDNCLYNKIGLDNISYIPVSDTSPYSNPYAGCMYYDDTEDKLYIYDGSVWDYVTVTDG